MTKLTAADRAAYDARQRYLAKIKARNAESDRRAAEHGSTGELSQDWYDRALLAAGIDVHAAEREDAEGEALVREARTSRLPELPDTSWLDKKN